MRRLADARAADAFVASRVEGRAHAFGTLQADAATLAALSGRARLPPDPDPCRTEPS